MTFPVFAPGDILAASDMNAVGLWVTKATTTFSAVSTIAANTVFTTDYDSYLVVFNYTTTTASGGDLQFTVGGVAAATNYNRQSLNASSTTISGARSASQTSAGSVLVGTNGAYEATVFFWVSQVAKATATNYKYERVFSVGNYTDPQISHIQGNHSTATAYDGFLITMSGGTTSGNYVVYGMKP